MEMETTENIKVGFIGAGKMAYSLACGFVHSGAVSASNMIASCRHPSKPNPLKEVGIAVTGDNSKVVTDSRVVFISVKPYQVEAVLKEVSPVATLSHLFVSIAGGITVAALEKSLPADVSVVRTIPNLPTQVGSGITVMTPGSRVKEEDMILVRKLLSSVGSCEEVPEHLMNSANGICGCGPAFMFTAIEALSDGGVRMGVPRDMAIKLAAQTMIGAGRMVLELGEHPGRLKDAVCSPGGSTIAGIHALEKSGFRAALIDAVVAAAERSNEMGK